MENIVFKKNLDYEVKIENFEGPLDLLLFLIKEAKIDIKDIFVSEVTDQYILYMSTIATLDMEKASEFLEIAATLLEIKSNSLLPKIEDIMLGGEEDPAQKMIRQLEEYKLLKEASEKLKLFENINRFYKIPDDSVYNVKIILKDMNLEGLLDAFSKLLTKVEQKQRDIDVPKEILRDPFTVEQKINFIKDTLISKRQVSFIDLFDKNVIKNEVITTFQALLEITKEQFATIKQNAVYDDILITITEDETVGKAG